MSEETDSLFRAFFALEDIREILRKTTPKHQLDKEQKDDVKRALDKVRNSLKQLEDSL